MSEAKPIGGKVWSLPVLFFLAVVVLALFFLAQRFFYGLGAVTNMNDGYPWGIWIAYDVVIGTAFACGGYCMALLVYIFNKGEYHPLVRPALMASMFGYTLAGVSVIFDIGRYWQAYNIMIPAYMNFKSVLLEVALCIGTYVLVLWIEFAPTFLEKLKADRLAAKLNKVIFVFIALGVLLPTMHQSSLGTMMLAAGYKLSPFWWTSFLPLLFLLSALIMGYAVVIFESTVAALAFNRPLETRILGKLSEVMVWILGFVLVVRFQDLNARDLLPMVFGGGFKANMLVLENLCLLAAMMTLIYPANRKNPKLLFLSAIAIMLGGGLYRMNTYLVGFDPGNGFTYFPSVPEMVITFAIISVEIVAYVWFVKRLPVLHEIKQA
ncbi:MAG: Ni/Fe-hydrogenase cytochrome b subunit [Proteobacteria bacterium]|nr:Ni/Fe-hydrogenase cytochrome b subunit [Pseudomonadota bacterium]MBU1736586.1 Ni/Fe-hydrogenase cytochrome b subunit [Pseudomonadota bacterium]